MVSGKHIVKRAGHTEPYDQRKLYASIYSAMLAVHETSGTAEVLAEKICNEVEDWLGDKVEVTSADIKRNTYKCFHQFHPDAAWIYLHQRNVS